MLLHWPQIFAGLGIGLIMSAPIGPVNFLCFHRTLHGGLLAGLTVGLGAVLGDAIFSSAAIFGVQFVSAFVKENLHLLRLAGGCIIIGFGIYLLKHKPPQNAAPKGKQQLWRGMATAFILATTNPGNFFGFMAMFSGLTDVITEESTLMHGASLVIGVVIGAAIWWTFLTLLTYRMRSKVTQGTLLRINRIAGSLIVAAGVLLIGRYLADVVPGLTGG